uniref:phosphoglycerate mutase (2,3-diphosphoglycerate-dependent) n=1 Tax=Chromera velia CCMP2878 TaxID=1169474 RepID=A0A0G4HLP0_9ALVE|eukprot:Cvel_28848.t1-p1 / transcript=Cvel_28848.t1 / gene=Cvel_28848 / organism=Chromera_velia_CCMP2878 / gene_product=Probable phosphoglycerate mutase, putative / transcript_product=Probable phosphoglycerate mutase, putative / location=Cvel_scaffold3849:4068-6676(+) / protein_length=314 / sequence_SO=supercontig / SO=protein_coding / is_pseudo=false
MFCSHSLGFQLLRKNVGRNKAAEAVRGQSRAFSRRCPLQMVNKEQVATVTEQNGKAPAYTFTIVRHGHSSWNAANLFTGWADVPLAEEGVAECKEAAEILSKAGMGFDIVHTSMLKRAIQTTWTILEEMDRMYTPIEYQWRLNERHYGELQGRNKKETVEKFGADQVQIWRRSYDIPPPPVEGGKSNKWWPGNDARYAGVPEEELPFSESLLDTKKRVLPCWFGNILPDIVGGKRVLVSAHGNSIRALLQYLDDIPDDVITELNVPTGVPLCYYLDENLQPLKHPDGIGPLSGNYLGDQEKIRARIEGVKKQTG